MDTVALKADEESVARLVDRFYTLVRSDDRLAPIFNNAIADWDAHLGAMRDFWSAVLTGTDRYHGCVMSAHFGLPMEAPDLDRFLDLFRPVANETLPPPAAVNAIKVSEAIIDNLRRVVGHP